MTCRQKIGETKDNFVIGGPYTHDMFDVSMFPPYRQKAFGIYGRTGNLICHNCSAFIAGLNGELLTEHGILPIGQKSIDTSFSILHKDGPLKGKLQRIELAKVEVVESISPEADHEGKDEPSIEEIQANVNDSYMNEAGKIECPKCGKTYRNSEKGQSWFEKHLKSCGDE